MLEHVRVIKNILAYISNKTCVADNQNNCYIETVFKADSVELDLCAANTMVMTMLIILSLDNI